MKKKFSLLSGILFFAAFLPYVWAIVHRQTVPSPVSWAIWAAVDTLALVAMKKANALNGQIMGAVAGAWVITTLALIFGEPTMGSIEWVSIVGAVAGIVLWQMTGKPKLAIICSQAAVFVGAVPTFASAYANPGLENPVAWSIWLTSCICMLIAVPKWDLANALQPITFTVIEAVMVILVVFRPLWLEGAISLATVLPVLAAFIHAIGFVKYNLQTKEGSSKPNFVSWFAWAFLATLNALTFSAATSFVNALTPVVGSVGCIGTFLHALFTGKFEWPQWREWAEMAISVVAIVVWKFYPPVYANLVLLAAFVISFEPTGRGVWENPLRESKMLPWVMWTIAYGLTAVSTYLFKGGMTLALIMPVVITACHGLVPVLCRKNRKARFVPVCV